jgi:hypothetical protein
VKGLLNKDKKASISIRSPPVLNQLMLTLPCTSSKR